MDIVSINNFAQLDALEEAWNRLAKRGFISFHVLPSYATTIAGNGTKFRLLTAVDNSQIIACACFIYTLTTKNFTITTKTLFRLPVRMVVLFGGCVVGDPSEDVIRKFFEVIINEGDFDLLSVGTIFINTPLYKAATNLRNAFTWTGWRKHQRWWLVRLPASFAKYLASIRETARAHISRDCRKFERMSPEFRLMRLPEEVDSFLRDAEKISRLTYHWNLDPLRNDERTRKHFLNLAKTGNLRCYIFYVKGKPCAFGWGELAYRRFYFRQTGYDPEFHRLSPGTALMMQMIRDLIENTDCEVFDFLWGGMDGYKSRLANTSFPCTSVQVAIMRPYSLFIGMLDLLLNLAKSLVALVVEQGPLKKLSRGFRRRHGGATF